MLVWNQVSGEEIRAGYRRGRLSVAISRDEGETWEHFKTIDRVVLPEAGRVEPNPEPGMVRGADDCGELPDEYGAVHYPDVAFNSDEIIITYGWSRVSPPEHATKLRIMPLGWFYE